MGHSTADRSATVDHGYAWIVTLAVSGSNLLVMGYFRSFSVFFVEIVDTFHTSYTLASVIMGVQGAVCCVTTLVVHNALLERYGVRPVTFCGGLVFSTGMLLSYFAESALFIFFTLGVLVGVGNGAVYSPGTVLLGQYFEKRRALATSLACVGGSVGSMTLPVLATELILQYGLKGAFMLFGGLNLHLCLTSALYRPPPPPILTDSSTTAGHWEASLLHDADSSSADKQHTCHTASSSNFEGTHKLETASLKECSEMNDKNDFQKPGLSISADKLHNGLSSSSSFDSVMRKHIPGHYLSDKEKGCISSQTLIHPSKEDDNTKGNSHGWLLPVLQTEKPKEYASAQNLAKTSFPQHHDVNKRHGTLPDLTFRTCSRNLGTFSQSCRLSQILRTVETTYLFSSQPHLEEVSSLLTEAEKIVATGKTTNSESEELTTSAHDEPTPNLWQTFCACLSGGRLLLRNPLFWIIQVYSGLGYIGSQAAFIYLSSLLQEKGMSKEDVAVALTVWGACSLVGRLLCGVLTDRQILRPITLTALGFLLLGALFFLVPVLPDGMEVWMAFTVAYGLLEGLYYCLMPVIIIDLLTLQHFSSVYGFTRIAHSTAVTLFFPLLGQLRDQTGDYNATFCFMGVCAIVSASMLVLSSLCHALRHSRTLPDTN